MSIDKKTISRVIDFANYGNAINKDECVKFLLADSKLMITTDDILKIVNHNPILKDLYEDIQDLDCWKELVQKFAAQEYPYMNELLANTTFLNNFLVKKFMEDPTLTQYSLLGTNILMGEEPPANFNWFELLKIKSIVAMAPVGWPIHPKATYKCLAAYSGFDAYGFAINILEAVVFDIQRGYLLNAFAGVVLTLTIPYIFLYNLNKKTNHVHGQVSLEWCHLYNSWNACFVLKGFRATALPMAFPKLLSSQMQLRDVGASTWPLIRGLTLSVFIGQYMRLMKDKEYLERDTSAWDNVHTEAIAAKWGYYNACYALRYFISTINLFQVFVFVVCPLMAMLGRKLFN